jgi:hypothetical protein
MRLLSHVSRRRQIEHFNCARPLYVYVSSSTKMKVDHLDEEMKPPSFIQKIVDESLKTYHLQALK